MNSIKLVPWTTHTLQKSSKIVRFHVTEGNDTVKVTKWWGIVPEGVELMTRQEARIYCKSLRAYGYELIKYAS